MIIVLLILVAALIGAFSSRYRKPALLVAIGIFAGEFLWYSVLPIDELKYWAFDKYCESADEKVVSHLATDKVAIEYRPWSGVMEDSYYPSWLTRELLKKPGNISDIQLIYDVPRDKVASDSCTGRYVISVNNPKKIIMPPCGKMVPSTAVSTYPVFVAYEYGAENILSIRPFRFIIKDTKTGGVLAEQNSYQLLLGGMHRRSNQRLYGWGSSQGARVCKITPPKELILKVVGNGG